MKTDLKITKYQEELLNNLAEAWKSWIKLFTYSLRSAWKNYLNFLLAYIYLLKFALEYYILTAIINGKRRNSKNLQEV